MVDIRGTKLHVAGLDSAWMACGDDDRGRLFLGHGRRRGAVWRIALLHHRWDYLAEFEGHENPDGHASAPDLLLRGHLHRPAPERIRSPPAPARV